LSAPSPSSAPSARTNCRPTRPCPSKSTSSRSPTTTTRLPARGPHRRRRRGVLLVRGTPRLQHRRRRPQHVRPPRRLARQTRQGAEREHGTTRRRASVHRLVPQQGRPVRRQALRLPGKGPELRHGTYALRARRPRDHPHPADHRGRALPPSGWAGQFLATVARDRQEVNGSCSERSGAWPRAARRRSSSARIHHPRGQGRTRHHPGRHRARRGDVPDVHRATRRLLLRRTREPT
jgi:hypothetical protein